MAHCSYFTCAMNESKSILQAENQPLFLCPVCLRKLQKAVGFNIIERYRALSSFLNSITHSDLGNKVDFQYQHHSGEQEPLENSECKFELSVHWIKSILLFIENKIHFDWVNYVPNMKSNKNWLPGIWLIIIIIIIVIVIVVIIIIIILITYIRVCEATNCYDLSKFCLHAWV